MRHLFQLGLCLAFLLTGPIQAAEINSLELRNHEVAAERDAPQVCLNFSDKLERNAAYDRFVRVEPAIKAAFQVRENTLCIDGFLHGQRYTLTLRKGFPAVEGKVLEAQRQVRVNVRDRAPQVSFRSGGYILTHVEDEGLQIRTLNVARVRMQVLRIKDQGVLEQMHMGLASKSLTDADVENMIGRTGERLWQGDMAVDSAPNKPVTTVFPIKAALGDLAPGAYVAVAESAEGKGTGSIRRAVQWFLISDLGLTAFSYEDGVLVYVRSLKTAQPRAGVALKLVGSNNEDLGQATTAEDGTVRFSFDRGKTPKALFARSEAGDFSFMEVGSADAARQGDTRAFLYTEAGIYKPGSTVHLTALLRTHTGEARTGMPLVFSIKRPDGVEVERRTLNEELAGGYTTRLELSPTAHAGVWTVIAYLGATDKPVGKASFVVEDYAPARLDFSVMPDRATIGDDGRVRLNVAASLQNGVPAGNVSGEIRATLRPSQQVAYPGFENYRFGLAQESPAPEQVEIRRFATYASGKGRVELKLDRSGDTTRPLEAVLQTTLFDVDGRAVSHEVVVPLRPAPFAIGIRPLFGGGALPENATAAFDIVAIGGDGQAIDRPNLSYELFEEKSEYLWFETEGRWDYRTIIKDRRVTGGVLNVSAAKPTHVEEQVVSGRFRLEVFDPESGVATSVRFSAGWWLANAPGDQPGKVEVTLMKPSYKPGQVAWVFVRPPYPAQVLLTVSGRKVHSAMTRTIGEEGAFLEIPVQDWIPGAYVLATAYAASDEKAGMAQRRAVGSAWLSVDSSARKLNVSIHAPKTVQPHQAFIVPLKIKGVSEGKPAHLTLSVVDDATIQASEGVSADPVSFFLQRPVLGVNVRDAQGILVRPDSISDTAENTSVDAIASKLAVHTGNGVSLFSGIQTVGADGTVSIPVELPEGSGRLRLAATVWSADNVGYAETSIDVQQPVAISMNLPRSIKSGDEFSIDYALQNVAGPAGTYRLKATASGALKVEGNQKEFGKFQAGQSRIATLKLSAVDAGTGELRLEVTGPDNFTMARTWTLNVERAQFRTARTMNAEITPGTPQTLAITELAAGLKGPRVFYTVSTLPGLNTPLLLSDVLGTPVQNIETVASRGLALLSARDVAKSIGVIATDDAYGTAIANAIKRVADLQRADGSFSVWTHQGGTNYWQSVYAMEFLTRARKAGHFVPELPYGRGIEFLKRTMGGDWTEDKELALRSYTLNVLARSGAVDAGAVAYFQDNHWNRLPTQLSRAHIANALAVAGDSGRARDAFAKLGAAQETSVQDDAETLAMMAESGAVGEEELRNALRAMKARLKDGMDHLHIQARTWLLLAANALRPLQGNVQVKLKGVSISEQGPVTRMTDAKEAVQIENTSDRTLYVTLTIVGESQLPISAEESGLSIKRSVFDTKGRPVNLSKLRQNQSLVVVLEGHAGSGVNRVLLTDTVPTGFEIETLSSGQGEALDMPWLGELSLPVYAADQHGWFVAAVDVGDEEKRDVRVAYRVHATMPGIFQAPGAYMESMNRPDLFARTPSSQVTVEKRREAN